MTRGIFGGGTADIVYRPFPLLGQQAMATAPGAVVTFWDAPAGGTQHTDLLVGGVAAASAVADTLGLLPALLGPPGVGEMWEDAGGGTRRLVVACSTRALAVLAADRSLTGLRGPNLAGPDFDGNPGGGYSATATVAMMAARGHRLIRQPFRWDAMQPTLGAALNSVEVAEMHRILDAAAANGMGVVLDSHDYGGRGGKTGPKIGAAGGPTTTQFADLWSRIATEFGTHPAVFGYDLMNEPESMPLNGQVDARAAWYAAAQAAVNAIRGVDTHTYIVLESYASAPMGSWQNGSPGFATGTLGVKDKYVVTDSSGQDHILFSPHHYWSSNYDYAAGIAANQNYPNPKDGNDALFRDVLEKAKVLELRGYLSWLTRQQAHGMIGEWGTVRNDAGSTNTDATLWGLLADRWFAEIDAWHAANPNLRLWVTQWAGGDPWSAGYNQRMYDAANQPYVPGVVGERHLTLPGRRRGAVTAGTTTIRPLATAVAPGTAYFDSTLNKPIFSTGSAWVDATGATA